MRQQQKAATAALAAEATAMAGWLCDVAGAGSDSSDEVAGDGKMKVGKYASNSPDVGSSANAYRSRSGSECSNADDGCQKFGSSQSPLGGPRASVPDGTSIPPPSAAADVMDMGGFAGFSLMRVRCSLYAQKLGFSERTL
jgi:hypothetical protein